jgi:hypothetical protein
VKIIQGVLDNNPSQITVEMIEPSGYEQEICVGFYVNSNPILIYFDSFDFEKRFKNAPGLCHFLS